MKRTITLKSRITTATVTRAITFPSAARKVAPVATTAVSATGSADPNTHRLEP
ncbi:MAG: hypothetical protein QOJ08_75 [Ilumatobacteraceae bacterium]